MDEATVKEVFIGAVYAKQAVMKYKALNAWQHKERLHLIKKVD